MTNCSQIRAFAWNRLWKGRWFWKLFAVTLFMQICMRIVFSFLASTFEALGIDDWMTYGEAWIRNWQDQVTPIPKLTEAYILHATGAMVFAGFLGLVLIGITAYAGAIVLLKCLKDDRDRWFADSLAGFKMPFGLFGLAFVRSLIGFVWVGLYGLIPSAAVLYGCRSYLLSFADSPTFVGGAVLSLIAMAIFAWIVFCTLVPFYRYRFLYLIKAQHPDYSVRECIRASREWMKGRAWESFKLDCSYWKIITLDLVFILAFAVLCLLDFYAYILIANDALIWMLAIQFFLFIFIVAHIVVATVLVYYISVGQGKFYLNYE